MPLSKKTSAIISRCTHGLLLGLGLLLSSCTADRKTTNGSFVFDLAPALPPQPAGQSQFNYDAVYPALKPGDKYRLLLLLHAVGETRGDSIEKWQKTALKHKTIIVAPDLEWPVPLTSAYLAHFFEFVDDLIQKYPVDPARIYVAGVSAGGAVGTHLIIERPEFWRGAVIISSLGFDQCLQTENKLEKIKDYKKLPPLLYVHGMQDAELYETVLNGLEFLLAHGVQAQFHSYEHAGHEHRPEWNKRIFEWIQDIELNEKPSVTPAT